MKIEVKITDEAGNVQQYDVSGSLLSDENLESAANRYAESENSCYINDYYGYLRGAKEVRALFIPKMSEQ
jgi:hypothetical protein